MQVCTQTTRADHTDRTHTYTHTQTTQAHTHPLPYLDVRGGHGRGPVLLLQLVHHEAHGYGGILLTVMPALATRGHVLPQHSLRQVAQAGRACRQAPGHAQAAGARAVGARAVGAQAVGAQAVSAQAVSARAVSARAVSALVVGARAGCAGACAQKDTPAHTYRYTTLRAPAGGGHNQLPEHTCGRGWRRRRTWPTPDAHL